MDSSDSGLQNHKNSIQNPNSEDENPSERLPERTDLDLKYQVFPSKSIEEGTIKPNKSRRLSIKYCRVLIPESKGANNLRRENSTFLG